jgi:hypothetical protein
MELVGTQEAATRALSLLAALLAVPAAWWAARAAAGRRAGLLAAAGVALCPFLTAHAQETRMYALVALGSLLAAGSFVRAVLQGRRRHLPALALWLALLLHTHGFAVPLCAALGLAALGPWRSPRVRPADLAAAGAAVALAYAPWLPSALAQAAHTGAPWAERPGVLHLLAVPGGLLGHAAAPVLAVALALAVARAPRPGPPGAAPRVLALVAALTAVLAWAAAQVQPAWSPRYLAVLLGPLVVAVAAVLARAPGRSVGALLAAVGATWALTGAPPAKSNAREVATALGGALRPGDLVASPQPEQVPVLHRYVHVGVAYVTPLGPVWDPRLCDWRDALGRLREGTATRVLLPRVDRLARGRRVLLVAPAALRGATSPWARAVRARAREWRAALRAHPRLRLLVRLPAGWPTGRPAARSTVGAELYVVHGRPRPQGSSRTGAPGTRRTRGRVH